MPKGQRKRDLDEDGDATQRGAKKPGVKDFLTRKPKHYQQKREKNQYHFHGFYERLKALDVK